MDAWEQSVLDFFHVYRNGNGDGCSCRSCCYFICQLDSEDVVNSFIAGVCFLMSTMEEKRTCCVVVVERNRKNDKESTRKLEDFFFCL